MTITELINELEKYRKEVGCDGERIGAHNYKSQVNFALDDPDIDIDIELDEIGLTYHIGCMCPNGITIWLKRAEK